MNPNLSSLVVFVDVDDTMVRTIGARRIPIVNVVNHVRQLTESGATLYCWSTGGAEYARSVASELGLAHCFSGFLPKPHVIVDDQSVEQWRYCKEIHPLNITVEDLSEYERLIRPGAQ